MKKIFILPLILILLLSLAAPVFAEGEETNQTIPAERQVPLVVDNAGVLDASQNAELLAKLESISTEFQNEVGVVIVNSLEGQNIEAAANDFYDYNGFGYGEGDDGMLLYLSVGDREAWISTYGAADEIVTISKQDKIWDSMMSYLQSDMWFEASMTFADSTRKVFVAENSINPMGFLYAIIIGLIIALVATLMMRRALKTVRWQAAAQEYVTPGSLNIRNSSESFLYTNTTRIKRVEKEVARAVSSSGRSHGGSGRSF